MTALLVVGAEGRVPGPLFVVAGGLVVAGRPAFSTHVDGDLAALFDDSNADWDGHCWAVLGDWIVDVSLCRTAYSGKGPPGLRQHVESAFGTGRGVLAFKSVAALEAGMEYQARYVLSDRQVEGLARGAWSFVKP